MNSLILSIIIPVYNRSCLVGEMLDSIKAQTLDNWECIIIDDGSNDGTEDVVKSYYDYDKSIHYHKKSDYHKREEIALEIMDFQFQMAILLILQTQMMLCITIL